MKKFISVILVLTCLFALCSCSALSKIPFVGKFFGGSASAFSKAIENTNPSVAIIETTVDTSLGELKSKYDIVYNADGSAVITYSYERFNEIGAEELKSTYTGTITRAADGTYSGDMEAVDVSGIAEGIALDLSAINEDAIVINEAGDVLTATVAAADTAAVFGTAVSKDVTLEITIANDSVTYISMTYEGAKITCRYE